MKEKMKRSLAILLAAVVILTAVMASPARYAGAEEVTGVESTAVEEKKEEAATEAPAVDPEGSSEKGEAKEQASEEQKKEEIEAKKEIIPEKKESKEPEAVKSKANFATVTGSPYEEKVIIPFEKIWDDNNLSEKRPESIKISLYKYVDTFIDTDNAIPVKKDVTITAEDGWKYNFDITDEPIKTSAGTPYKFRVVEKIADNYEQTAITEPTVTETAMVLPDSLTKYPSNKVTVIDFSDLGMTMENSITAFAGTNNEIVVWTPNTLTDEEKQAAFVTIKNTKWMVTGNVKFSDLHFVYGNGASYGGISFNTETQKVTIQDESIWSLIGYGAYQAAKITTTKATITNTLKVAPAEVALEATKELQGRAWGENESFTFTLYKVEGNTETEIEHKEVTETSPKATFTAASYDKAGTYNYVIRETGDLPGGMYNSGEIKAEVTVTKNDTTMAMEASVVYTPESDKIINTYDPSATRIVLKGTKTMDGRTLADQEFEFKVTEDGEEVSSGKNDASGDITFDAINYTETGTHTYVIKEVLPEDATAETGYTYKGVHYDSSEKTVVVSVTDNAGSLQAKVVEEESDDIAFVNAYKTEPTSLTLEGTKTLVGHDVADYEFLFQVKEGEEVVAEGKSDGDGGIAFDEIKYEEAGNHEYTVVEVNTAEPGIIYDEAVLKVKVAVTDDQAGQLVAAIDEMASDAIAFVNTYEKVDLLINKTWEDDENKYKCRPKSITVNIYANNDLMEKKVITADDGWKYEIKDLDRYVDGAEVIYTVTEKKVRNYSTDLLNMDMDIDGRKTFVCDITNTISDHISGHDEDPELEIKKVVVGKPKNGKKYQVGETVKYKITVTNIAEWTAYNVAVTDELTGDDWSIDELEPGESKEFFTTYQVTKADAKAGKVLNIATVEADNRVGDPSNQGTITAGATIPATKHTSDAVKTGDDTHIYLWMFMALLSAVIMIGAVITGWKKRLIRIK